MTAHIPSHVLCQHTNSLHSCTDQLLLVGCLFLIGQNYVINEGYSGDRLKSLSILALSMSWLVEQWAVFFAKHIPRLRRSAGIGLSYVLIELVHILHNFFQSDKPFRQRRTHHVRAWRKSLCGTGTPSLQASCVSLPVWKEMDRP